MRTPTVTEDEIANAAGVGDMHDGVNFIRASCVIAVEKAQQSFDPLLDAMRTRMAHVMKRIYPAVAFMLSQKGQGMDQAHNKPFHEIVQHLCEGGSIPISCYPASVRALTCFHTTDSADIR